MKKILFVVCILSLAFTKAFAEDCQHEVALFLSRPSYENYLKLNRNDLSADSDACWPELNRDTNNLARLYKHAKQGNKFAIKILIKHTSDLDGGELEDAHRALGESLDIKPSILLIEFKEQRMTENEFAQVVTMLPLSFTNNESGKVSALKTRKRKILSIKDISLKQQKELAAKAIDRRIKRILEEWP